MSYLKRTLCITICSCGVLIPSARSSAGLMYFDDRAEFETAVGQILAGFESFEDSFAEAPSVNFPVLDTVQFTLSEIGGINKIYSLDGASGSNSDGGKVARFVDNGDSVAVFDFTAPISAFGLDLTTPFQSVSRTVSVGGDVATSFDLPAKTSTFFGVINDSDVFQRITFDLLGTASVDFDSVTYGRTISSGDIVPEPSAAIAWSLIGFTVGGFAWLRRRK